MKRVMHSGTRRFKHLNDASKMTRLANMTEISPDKNKTTALTYLQIASEFSEKSLTLPDAYTNTVLP